MKQYLAPSIICGDQLNLEREINYLNEAKPDFIHFDIMDTSFSPLDPSMCLQPSLIPAFREKTDIPLDIHIEVNEPYYFIKNILPYCKDCIIQVHVESCVKLIHYINLIKNNGAIAGVALNCGTSSSLLEDIISEVSLVDILTTNNPSGKHIFNNQVKEKIKKIRKMADAVGNKDLIIEVDGGISFDIAKECKELGANCYVLGTKSIYKQNKSVVEKINEFKEFINQ